MIDDADYLKIQWPSDWSGLNIESDENLSDIATFAPIIDKPRVNQRHRGKLILTQYSVRDTISKRAAHFFEDCDSFWHIPSDAHRDWLLFEYNSPIYGPRLWEHPVRMGEMGEYFATCLHLATEQSLLHIPIDVSLDGHNIPGIFVSHHAAHASSSYYSSEFDEAIVYTLYGGTGLKSGFAFHGTAAKLYPIGPHFLECGEFYDHVASRLGLGLIGGAGKLMGLSSYGEGLLNDVLPAGTGHDWKIWAGCHTNSLPDPVQDFSPVLFDALVAAAKQRGLPVDSIGDPEALPNMTANEIACAVQSLVEQTISRTIPEIRNGFLTAKGSSPDNLCISGGVALNCPSNRRVWSGGEFSQVHIEPHCEDGGLSIGAAHYLYNHVLDNPPISKKHLTSNYAMIGPALNTAEELELLAQAFDNIRIERIENLECDIAQRLANNEIVALYEGRSETGPRALGHRSILAHPGHGANWRRVNAVKGREEWRPFAPAILHHRLNEWFSGGPDASPFMLFTYHCLPGQAEKIPAVVHVDRTSRVQTIAPEDGTLYRVLVHFENATGLPVLLNTSFNGPGSPIIETCATAVDRLRNTQIDALYVDGFLVRRANDFAAS